MSRFHTALLGALALALVPVLTAPRPAAALDLDTFKANMVKEFDGKFVGYAFAIARKGKIRRAGAGGKARIAGDGNKKMTTRTRQNVASVSKTITAIAVLQLLEKNRLSIESPVAPYLPKHWKRGPGFRPADSLTFRQLLTHTSGLKQRFQSLSEAQRKQWGNNWEGLKFVVKKGIRKSDVGTYGYKNANYALFRIIIPILWMKSRGKSWDHVNANSAGPMYMLYVGEHIFVPSGVQKASCREPSGSLHAAGYDVTNPQAPGALWNVDQKNCGGHGNWHLSARNLANIALRADCRNHDVLPAGQRLLSKAACFARDLRRLGWDRSSNGSSKRHKNKYWHGGTLFTSKSQPHKALHSCVAKLPDSINVAAMVNSSSTDGQSPCAKILDAFEASS
jgi:hypothetical protein